MKSLFWVVLVLCVTSCTADEHDHVYKDGDDVIVWVNTLGPYENRQETYEYYQLPYCIGSKDHNHYHETLGEALQGMQLVDAGYDIHFKQATTNMTLCSTEDLSKKQNELFRYAVANDYYFQMFIDDLPVGGYVGKKDEETGDLMLYTHILFNMTYNRNQIVEAKIVSGNAVSLNHESSAAYRLSYSVEWSPTSDKFESRFEKYLDSEFFEHKIHWVSILNSFMMVLFLTGMVAVILLRTLHRDLSRYDKGSELGDFDRDLGDDYGWKQVHGDVFRPPGLLSWLSALVGIGFQLVVLSLVVVSTTIIGDLYEQRASILTVSIFLYAVTTVVAGYFSGSLYSQYSGKNWIRAMFVTAGLWPGAVSAVSFIINFIAISYSSSKAIPFGTMVAIVAIWLFIVFPLTLLGTIVGRNWNGVGHFPTRVNPIPRPIPEKLWYQEPLIIVLLAGLLPFGSIFIEMYFVFTSFWAYKIYYVYGFLFLVVIMLLVVTSCVSIVSTYFLLNSEDHRWHWISFLSGGSVALYVYGYAIHYFFAKTKMYGLFQTSFYFGYTAVLCYGLFMMCGSVGYLSASLFIKRIYSTVKID